MKLSAYLNENEISLGDFAKRIGLSHEAVRLYVRGGRVPRADVMARIVDATGGAVTPTDFYDLPSTNTHQSPEPHEAA